MAIDITTISVEMDTSGLKKGQVELDKTAKFGQAMAKDIDAAAKTTKKGLNDIGDAASNGAKAADQATKAMGGLGRSAGAVGVQIQQLVGQIQGGQSAFTALSQQGADIGIVLGAPLIGAIVGIGAVIAGTLLPAIFSASKAMDDMGENTKKLIKNYADLDAEQRKVVDSAMAYLKIDTQKKMIEENKQIDEQVKKLKQLNAEHGTKKTFFYGTDAASSGNMQVVIDNTKKIAEAEKQLAAIRQSHLVTAKELEALNDPSGIEKKNNALRNEAALVNKTGKEYWELKAAQEGLSGAGAKEFVALNLLIEENKKAEKDRLEEKKKTQSFAKKALSEEFKDLKALEQAERNRADLVAKALSDLQRDAALMGEQSKEAQARYDIEQGILKVKGGINGAEAQSIINAAALYDAEKAAYDSQKQYAKDMQKWIDDQQNAKDKAISDATKKAEDASKKISDSLTDALMRGFENGKSFAQNMADTLKNTFKTMVLRPKIEAITAKVGDLAQKVVGALPPIVQTIAAVGSVVGGIWNNYMNKAFLDMTSEIRQSRQSTGTLLGNANAKSDSINHALNQLGDNGKSLLDVNHGMYQALVDIRAGIGGSAAGFAKTGLGSSAGSGIKTGTSTLSFIGAGSAIGSKLLGDTVGGFIDALVNTVAKAIYNKKTSVIDSGIQILGGTLADAISKGTIGAMNYAEVQTTKKILGLTYSNKVNTQTSELDALVKSQFADVFEGAGNALKEAAKIFGANFDTSKLIIDATKLSLKDLKGDALTAEIEHFFSATVDKWANSLEGSLSQFQKVGEGAFETMLRLASQTNIFADMAEKLNLNFHATGIGAVNVTQQMATLAGGFDQLASGMQAYHDNFLSEAERTKDGIDAITNALASVGLSMPATREGFKKMVEGLDLSNDAQQKQFTALMNVSGAFAQLVPWTEKAVDSAKELTDTYDKIAEQQKTLSERLFDISATDAQKREALLTEALGTENKAIQQEIFAREDLLKVEQEATRVADERYSLESELLQVQGDTVALRNRELEKLDLSNRALKEQIYSLEDQQKAAEAATKAADEASKAHEQALNDARQAAEEQRELAQGVHASISGALQALLGESNTLNAMGQAQARMTLQGALMTAKSGGSLVGYSGLDEALKTVQSTDKNAFASAIAYRQNQAGNIGLLSELAKYTRVSGSHANGLDSVPYDGYIAQLHKGERVQSAKEAAGNNDLVSEIRQLRSDIKAGNLSLVQASQKTAKILERWDGDGQPETRAVS